MAATNQALVSRTIEMVKEDALSFVARRMSEACNHQAENLREDKPLDNRTHAYTQAQLSLLNHINKFKG